MIKRRCYIGGVCPFIYNCRKCRLRISNVVVQALKILNVLEDQNQLQPKKSPKKSKKSIRDNRQMKLMDIAEIAGVS